MVGTVGPVHPPNDVSGHNPYLPPGVSSADVRLHMERVLAADLFVHSQRLKDFLRYIVSHMLAGRAGEIKEYSIATEVLGRRENFDPSCDPVVRVEAHRLRSKLRAYQERMSGSDHLILDLPKGAYVPMVREALPKAIPPRRFPVMPEVSLSIAVLPFVDLRYDRPEGDILTDSLTEELIHNLGHERGLLVAPWASVAQFRHCNKDVREISCQLHVDILLEGSLRHISKRLAHVRVRIISPDDGFSKHLGSYDREMNDLLSDQRELGRAIVADLKLLLFHPSGQKSAGLHETA
jgi:TolB-like protein